VLLDEGRIPARGSQDYFSYKSGLHPKLAAELPAGLSAFWKKTHPFVSFQALGRCKQFSQAELKRLLDAFLEADLRIKSSAGDARLELERLALMAAGVEEEVIL
jgi:hypothetical protein